MTLWQFETRWAAIIGRSMVPVGLYGGLTDGYEIGARVASQTARSPWYSAAVVRLALWIAWLAPLLTLRRARTFGGLDERARVACLEALLHSNVYAVRETLKILKLNVCIALIGNLDVLAHLGTYDLGPYKLVDESTLRRPERRSNGGAEAERAS